MSAPRPGALPSIFSLEPGTERHDRRGRWRERSDMGKVGPRRLLQPCSAYRGRPVLDVACQPRAACERVELAAHAGCRLTIGSDARRTVRGSPWRPDSGASWSRGRSSTQTACVRRRTTVLKLLDDDVLDLGASADLIAALRARGYPAPTTLRLRRARRDALRAPGTHAGRAIGAADTGTRPHRVGAHRRCNATSGVRRARAVGRRHGRERASTAASATASTTAMTEHSDETRAMLDRLRRIADAAHAASTCRDRRRRALRLLAVQRARRRRPHHRRRRLGRRDERRRRVRSRHARRRTPYDYTRPRRAARRRGAVDRPRRARAVRRAHGAAPGRLVAPQHSEDFEVAWFLGIGADLLAAVGAG